MIIIPAIDVLDGKIVRLKKGVFSEVTYYSKSPLEQAIEFDSMGYNWLHLVDLEASKNGVSTIGSLIKEIKCNTELKIEAGGGVRTSSDVESLLSAGVDRVICGSFSVKNKPQFEHIISEFGCDNIIAACDYKKGKIAVNGWTEKSQIDLFEHIEYCLSKGVKHILCTDISRDGMLEGPAFEDYSNIICKFSGIKLIASGGISDLDDISELINLDLYAAVTGRAIYENRVDLWELRKFDS